MAGERPERDDPFADDWTRADDGHTNSSPIFLDLVDEVARLIRGQAYSLIAGNTESVARLVMAQLAHVHGLRPPSALATLSKSAPDQSAETSSAYLLGYEAGRAATLATPERAP